MASHIRLHCVQPTYPAYAHSVFFLIDTASTDIYTLSLHDALPILPTLFDSVRERGAAAPNDTRDEECDHRDVHYRGDRIPRSEEHTSELQSQFHLVCRLLLEKKKSISEPSLDS